MKRKLEWIGTRHGLLKSLLIIILIVVSISAFYFQTHKRVVLTIATTYEPNTEMREYQGNVAISEIFSDDSCNYFIGTRIGDSLMDKRFLEFGSVRGKHKSKGKISKDKLDKLLSLYNELQKYEYLRKVSASYHAYSWLLYNGYEYRLNLDEMVIMTPGGLDGLKERGYKPNEWEIKLDEFLMMFYLDCSVDWWSVE